MVIPSNYTLFKQVLQSKIQDQDQERVKVSKETVLRHASVGVTRERES